jgi:hypothetical protein
VRPAARAKKTARKISWEEKGREFFIIGKLEFGCIDGGKDKGTHHESLC